MKSSGSSSARQNPHPPHALTPKAFALTGRSRPLDPRTNAVRPDIADIRLAEYVFAPHYAAPLASELISEAMLRETRLTDSPVMAALSKGEAFELLDLTGGVAWGVATRHGLVGYVDAPALRILDAGSAE